MVSKIKRFINMEPEFFIYGIDNAIPQSLQSDALQLDVGYLPVITKQDVTFGQITRYFARQVNETSGEITEISKQTYDRLQTVPFYATVALVWRITGAIDDTTGVGPSTRLYTGVRTANRLALETANDVIDGMRYQITNLLQFYRP